MSIEEKVNKYVGQKKIKKADLTGEKTPSGSEIVSLEFDDGSIELCSELMFSHAVTDKKKDLSELRDLRVKPIVAIVLSVLRDWGIKLSELQYFSVLLQQSLDFNHSEAVKELWSKHMPKPQSPDEISLLVIDKVLKDAK